MNKILNLVIGLILIALAILWKYIGLKVQPWILLTMGAVYLLVFFFYGKQKR
jgi:hypothetical protein